MDYLEDFEGRKIRLTDERKEYIERRLEMQGQEDRIAETLEGPGQVRLSNYDDVCLYYRKYDSTPVTQKYLLVVVKLRTESPFVITAFFTDKIKSGKRIDTETGEEE